MRLGLTTRVTVLAGLASGTLAAAPLLGTSSAVLAAVADNSGAVYVAGITYGDLPTTPGVIQPGRPTDCPICQHGFVAKVAASGKSLEWATYFAGSGKESVSSLAILPDGNLVIGGSTTSTDLLPDTGGYQTKPASLFIAKISADGRSILAATYFGGASADRIATIKVNSDGSILLAGDALSDPFPTSAGAYQKQRGSAPPPPGYSSDCFAGPCSDQFLAKFGGNLKSLQFSTLFGSVIDERASDLAAGPDGTLYLAGTRGPQGAQGPGPTYPIISRFSFDGSSLLYTTDLSFRGSEGRSVAVDAQGNAYVASSSPRWYITNQPSSFLVKLSPDGAEVWSKAVTVSTVTSSAINSHSELVLAGLAGYGLQTTKGAPRFCSSGGYSYPVRAAVIRADITSAAVTYAGFLNADQSWLAGSEQVIAQNAFVGIQSYSLLPAGDPPAGTVTCMANAAVYDATSFAPGEVLSIFGMGIGPANPITATPGSDDRFPTELGGMRISIGGVESPILYADRDQINFVAPFAAPTVGTAPVEIRRNALPIATFERPVSQYHPGLFTRDGSVLGLLAALNQDGTVNSESNPASLGSIVSVFGTGFGTMVPELVDGTAPCSANSAPVTEITAQVFGSPSAPVVYAQANILYAGNAPCLIAGVVQINVRLPEVIKPSDGGTVTLSLRPGGGGYIAVR
jgi:uncharacterized protein (TIGR03437 family)